MKKEKMYFENEDCERCYPLSYHIENAKQEGLKQIELFEAIPNKDLCKEYVWCREFETSMEKYECNKTCHYYLQPGKGRICQNRGKLMDFGDLVLFDVETSLPILQ